MKSPSVPIPSLLLGLASLTLLAVCFRVTMPTAAGRLTTGDLLVSGAGLAVTVLAALALARRDAKIASQRTMRVRALTLIPRAVAYFGAAAALCALIAWFLDANIFPNEITRPAIAYSSGLSAHAWEAHGLYHGIAWAQFMVFFAAVLPGTLRSLKVPDLWILPGSATLGGLFWVEQGLAVAVPAGLFACLLSLIWLVARGLGAVLLSAAFTLSCSATLPLLSPVGQIEFTGWLNSAMNLSFVVTVAVILAGLFVAIRNSTRGAIQDDGPSIHEQRWRAFVRSQILAGP
ncbi:hypothetical protein VVR12_07680 [Rothia sp. LK2588]|uniref:hypothetical protein n=1 Tax=Rothia sp. LK2588 TaxID=3114369 RepID=UPI0034CD91BD